MLSKNSVVSELVGSERLGDPFSFASEDSCLVLGGQMEAGTLGPNSRWRRLGWRPEQPERHGLKVLHDGSEMELVAGAGKTSQPHALEAVMGFQVRKAHLDPLPLITRFQERLGLHFTASDVAGRLVDVPHNPARRHVWTAPLFEWAFTATRTEA